MAECIERRPQARNHSRKVLRQRSEQRGEALAVRFVSRCPDPLDIGGKKDLRLPGALEARLSDGGGSVELNELPLQRRTTRSTGRRSPRAEE